MPDATVIPFRPARKLVPLLPDSDLSRLASEGYALAGTEPRILMMIDRDRDAYALLKKKERVDDQAWLMSRGTSLPGFDVAVSDGWADDLELLTGRPRMPAELVLIFILLRGYFGGFKDRKTAMLLLESKTLEIVLTGLGLSLPGLSTILDNVNAISAETLEFILDAQIRDALAKDLDAFKELTVDSTGVEANSTWPTDSGIIAGLAARGEHLLRGLAELGVSLKLPGVVGKLVTDMEGLHKQIQLSSGKRDGAQKRKKFYRKLIKLAKKVRQILWMALERGDVKARSLELMPSMRMRLMARLESIEVDLENLALATQNAASRILSGEQVSADEKVLSLSDPSAAMIVKGGREPLLGYKPQIARSGDGLVTAVVVPEGNAADSGQLRIVVDASIKRTGVVPSVLSLDDGYTNGADRDYYIGLGIAVVSFSGSKGKRLIPSDEYESKPYADARSNRSAVESTIFTLKHNHDMGRVMRRGIANVRRELLEKAIAHNFFRMIALTRAGQEKSRAA